MELIIKPGIDAEHVHFGFRLLSSDVSDVECFSHISVAHLCLL